MKRIQFKKDIKAPAAHVYNIMLGIDDKATYEQWTAEFNPTSTYVGNWEKGSKMYFVGTDENGKKGGMISKIEDNIPNQFVSICHLGMLDGDKEITEGPEVEPWAGCMEIYSFKENNGITTVTVELDVTEEHEDYFNTTWVKALDKLQDTLPFLQLK